MKGETLNSVAYGLTTWQQIADDLVEYSKRVDPRLNVRLTLKAKSAKEFGAFTDILSQHLLMYYHRGFITPSEAINQLPADYKRQLVSFGKGMAWSVFSIAAGLNDWPKFSEDDKLFVSRGLIDNFREKKKIKLEIPVKCDHRLRNFNDSSENGIRFSPVSLNSEIIESLKILFHEAWHSFSNVKYRGLITKEELQTPVQIIRALDGFRPGYINPVAAKRLGDEQLYDMQIPELTATAACSYSCIALKEFIKLYQNDKVNSAFRMR